MRNRRRNIPDPFSPENPLHQTDRTDDRVRDHLDDNTPIEEEVIRDEDIFRDETDLIKDEEEIKKRSQDRTGTPLSSEEESGL